MKVILGFLSAILFYFQVQLWWGEGSFQHLAALNKDIQEQTQSVDLLKKRNEALQQEVMNLKQNYEAIEERARTDLGMIKKGERFVIIPS